MRWWMVGVCGLLLGAGCGDGGGVPGADAQVVDATADARDCIDPPYPTRHGQIDVTEVRLLDADAQALGLAGGVVTIDFLDLTTFDPASVVFDSRTSLGEGCLVQVFDLGADPAIVPANRVDYGDVAISGTQVPFNHPCSFNEAADRYLCVQASGAAEGAVVTPDLASSTTRVTLTTSPGSNLVGSHARIVGLTAGDNPVVFADAFAVVAAGAPTANDLVLATGAATGRVSAETAGAGAVLVALAGEGPVPGGAALADLLDDGSTEIVIGRAGPAPFTLSMPASGEGIDLDDLSVDPGSIPLDGNAAIFSCMNAGGSCGATPGWPLRYLVVAGETTDTSPEDGDPGFLMRPPTRRWANWRCAVLTIGADSVTIPSAAMAAILDTGPRRIQLGVFHVSADSHVDSVTCNRTDVTVGHGVVGHTTPPAAAP